MVRLRAIYRVNTCNNDKWFYFCITLYLLHKCLIWNPIICIKWHKFLCVESVLMWSSFIIQCKSISYSKCGKLSTIQFSIWNTCTINMKMKMKPHRPFDFESSTDNAAVWLFIHTNQFIQFLHCLTIRIKIFHFHFQIRPISSFSASQFQFFFMQQQFVQFLDKQIQMQIDVIHCVL